MRGLSTAELDVENFAMITHSVPVERVRDHVPEMFELDTIVDASGETRALITASCFCNRDFHWSAIPQLTHDFNQNTFRTYVTYKGLKGSYFFGTYVGTRLSFVGQCIVAANSYYGDFEVDTSGGASGYPSYSCRTEVEHGRISFELTAVDKVEPKAPFSTGDQMAEFITHRLHGFAKSPLGFQVHGPVEHRRMRPWAGRLISGTFDFWEMHDILFPDEFDDPYSVLVEPSVHFTLHPPRPA